ncbi:MAG: hypothetical protein H7Z19_24120 [Chitinophagaceae bacterium]|nr:hypothetical protein [Rubrivivax sp.]
MPATGSGVVVTDLSRAARGLAFARVAHGCSMLVSVFIAAGFTAAAIEAAVALVLFAIGWLLLHGLWVIERRAWWGGVAGLIALAGMYGLLSADGQRAKPALTPPHIVPPEDQAVLALVLGVWALLALAAAVVRLALVRRRPAHTGLGCRPGTVRRLAGGATGPALCPFRRVHRGRCAR